MPEDIHNNEAEERQEFQPHRRVQQAPPMSFRMTLILISFLCTSVVVGLGDTLLRLFETMDEKTLSLVVKNLLYKFMSEDKNMIHQKFVQDTSSFNASEP